MDEFSDLQRLLRLKRHEAPPSDYLEDFLIEFRQRQRAELLKRPLWRLVVDRIEAALPVAQLPRYAYAGSCAAAVVIAGLASARILTAPTGGEVATATHGGWTVAATNLKAAPPKIDFYSRKPTFPLSELDFEHPRSAGVTLARVGSAPRYVLDSQPVSYGQPFSF